MKLNKLLVLLFFSVSITFPKNGACQQCLWSIQVGGTEDEGARDIAMDKAGNIYIAGGFESYPLPFTTDTLEYFGINGMYVSKFNPDGTEEWAKQFGGLNPYDIEYIAGIAIDSSSGDVFLCGSFFGNATFSDTTLFGENGTIFVVKLNQAGNVTWARSAGGTGDDVCTDIACDQHGYLYISGHNNANAMFDTHLVERGGFLAKYDTNGSVIWAKNKFRYHPVTFGYCEADPESIMVCNNNVIVNGTSINDTIIVDTIQIVIPVGLSRSFLAFFDAYGNISRLLLYGIPSSGSGASVSSDKAGNIYTTGVFSDECIFGSDTLVASHGGDCFLAKFASNGDFLWTRQLFVTDVAWGYWLTCDSSNTVYVAGKYSGTAFPNPFTISSTEINETFIIRYASDGTCLGALTFPNVGNAELASDKYGNLAMTGSFVNSTTIGPNTFIAKGASDIYLALCNAPNNIPESQAFYKSQLEIFANPTTGKCNITLPDELKYDDHLVLYIYDSRGRLIQQTQITCTSETYRLDIQAQAAGIYQAVLTNGSKSYSGKIVFTGK
jgi:hypothetical protein